MLTRKINYTIDKEKLDFISIKTLDRITVEGRAFDKLAKETLFRKINSDDSTFKTKPVVKNGVLHYIDNENDMDRCLVFFCNDEKVRIEQYIQYDNSVYKLSTVTLKMGEKVPVDCAFMNLASEISGPVGLKNVDEKMFYLMFEFPINAYIYIVDYLNTVKNLCGTKVKDTFLLEKKSATVMHKITINDVIKCYTYHDELAKLIYM